MSEYMPRTSVMTRDMLSYGKFSYGKVPNFHPEPRE
jgi:hypothetical protein